MIWLSAVTPTPTPDQAFDPNDVTPGPIGFFATVGLFIAVGLIAMGLMRRSARVQERWAIREQLEAEEAAKEAAREADGDAETNGSDAAETANDGASDRDTQPPKSGN